MLISRKHNFIFIHIYKTAGTSLTNALAPFAAGTLQLKANRFLKKFNINYLDPQPYHAHIKACELAARMGEKAFSNFFTFAFVRNPWDWQVSLYTFMKKNPYHRQYALAQTFRDFKDYIRWRCTEEYVLQKDFIVDGQGRIMVDFVGRFEQVDVDFKEICSRIGISAELPRLNVFNERPYRSFYDEESIELVRETFKPDIELFGYRY